jgi:hypothetical protein
MMQGSYRTGLQYAACQCWPLICSELIDRGADVMATDKVVLMLLVISLFSHRPGIRSVCITPKIGNTPLHLVARWSELQSYAPDTVRVLLGLHCNTSRLSNRTRQATVSMFDAKL